MYIYDYKKDAKLKWQIQYIGCIQMRNKKISYSNYKTTLRRRAHSIYKI